MTALLLYLQQLSILTNPWDVFLLLLWPVICLLLHNPHPPQSQSSSKMALQMIDHTSYPTKGQPFELSFHQEIPPCHNIPFGCRAIPRKVQLQSTLLDWYPSTLQLTVHGYWLLRSKDAIFVTISNLWSRLSSVHGWLSLITLLASSHCVLCTQPSILPSQNTPHLLSQYVSRPVKGCWLFKVVAYSPFILRAIQSLRYPLQWSPMQCLASFHHLLQQWGRTSLLKCLLTSAALLWL